MQKNMDIKSMTSETYSSTGQKREGERREGERYNQVSITADKLISNHKELVNQSIPNEGKGFCLKIIFSKAALIFQEYTEKGTG